MPGFENDHLYVHGFYWQGYVGNSTNICLEIAYTAEAPMHAQREARGERPPGGRQGPTATMASVGHEGKKLCLRGERAPGGVPGSGGGGRHSFRGRGGRRRVPSAADAARRPGRGRCPAATTGRETCAFAAEGRRGSCPRAAAAEGTAFGAAEAAAGEDGDALGRP